MKSSLKITGMAFSLLLIASPAYAEKYTVRPFLIDESVAPRDIISRDITITSNAPNKQIIYATVNEITVGTEGELKEFIAPVMTDQTSAVTSWVEISRARIELEPGEVRTIPLTLRIHPYAKAGEYHVFLGFASAPNRPQAEAKVKAGDSEGVVLKVVVEDPTTESLHIKDLGIKKIILNEDSLGIAVTVENIGDAPSTPKGEIIFYDTRGEEVGSVFVNEEGTTIEPNETVVLSGQIPFYGEFGRYKASLILRYGDEGESEAFDVEQFYMIPITLLLLILLGIIIVSVSLTALLKRFFDDDVSYDDDEARELPVYVQTGREYEEKDHDITITKHE